MRIKNHFAATVILLVSVCAYFNQRLAYAVGSTGRQKQSNLILLHLLFMGDILHDCTRLPQNLIYLVKNLLITDNLEALVVYGSPYIKKLSTLLLPIHVPVVFSRKPMI